ncbi:MAG: hypothetical protein ACI8X5_002487 [Planctomycetota bacterium]|jgi:hypothetical protein
MQDEPKNPMATPTPLWRKLLMLVLVGVPLGLVLGDLGLRGLLMAKSDTYDAQATRVSIVELRSRLTDALPGPADAASGGPDVKQVARTRIIHPFVGFDELGTLNQMRRDKLERSVRSSEVYRIMILGGSVAGLFSMHGVGPLRTLLQASPELEGRRIEFMGYARGGYKQPQQLMRLTHLLVSGVRPDAVINLDGFNEVALGNKNRSVNMDPNYPSYSHWMRFAGALGQGAEQQKLFARAERAKEVLVSVVNETLADDHFWSATWGFFTKRQVERARNTYESARDEYMEHLGGRDLAPGVLGSPFEGSVEEGIQECVDLWMESSRQIQSLCELYDMDYLHVLQPTLHDPGAKPMAPTEIEKGKISALWKEGVLIGYPLLRASGEELAAEGLEFFDASMIFKDVTRALYHDSCHFSKDGNNLLAQAIAEALLESLGDG